MKIDGDEYVARALTYLGRSYVWGTHGPNTFDCSGLVTRTIRDCGGPDWLATHNTVKLFSMGVLEPWLVELERAFPREIPRAVALALQVPPGTLVFYGDGGISHVMVATGDGRVLGACGGDRTTKTPITGACVQFRPSIPYRSFVRGFRLLPEVIQ